MQEQTRYAIVGSPATYISNASGLHSEFLKNKHVVGPTVSCPTVQATLVLGGNATPEEQEKEEEIKKRARDHVERFVACVEAQKRAETADLMYRCVDER